jgi:hypothetical protein
MEQMFGSQVQQVRGVLSTLLNCNLHTLYDR